MRRKIIWKTPPRLLGGRFFRIFFFLLQNEKCLELPGMARTLVGNFSNYCTDKFLLVLMGADQRVKRAQKREPGPPSAPAEMFSISLFLCIIVYLHYFLSYYLVSYLNFYVLYVSYLIVYLLCIILLSEKTHLTKTTFVNIYQGLQIGLSEGPPSVVKCSKFHLISSS